MVEDTRSWHLRHGDWRALKDHAIPIRHAVFILEQNVPESLELDELDANCHHWLVLDYQGSGIATGRLTPTGHIGRLAVLAPWRGQGIGRAIIKDMLRYARENGRDRIVLNAQTHAIGFYSALGFVAEGPEFDDAGIPHRRMVYGRHQGA
ncbi:MAG: GNAT family N-acetyltransferase [Ectothiorhodospiraceae bacterium]|nr:GNAT family N-acetyltransferase [Ectothiorhodospiraceae bacterium]